DALQSAVRRHNLDHILFPADVVRDAAQIVSDLRTFFPPVDGRYIFGPMAQINWGTPALIEPEIAIILELPEHGRLVILGQIATYLAKKEAPVVELHLDVLGVIDFGAKLLSIDGTLHDSRITFFDVAGDMAFRLFWGDPPNFAFSIGGFNKHYQPPPGFPELRRLTLSLGLDDPRISLETYLAVTSNTFQIGALAKLDAGLGFLSVHGHIGFDALFVFLPFSFTGEFSGGVELLIGDESIAGVHLRGLLSGPTPWHARGEACISILFFDVCVGFDATWGKPRDERLPAVNPAVPLLDAIQDPGNWSDKLPPAAVRVVTLAAPPRDRQRVMVDPVGSVVLRAKVAPLYQTITKFGETAPPAPVTFTIGNINLGGSATSWSRVDDYFAPAQFIEM